MAGMYAQIGDIVLSNTYGFSGFTNDQGIALVEHALIDAKPRIQSTGDNLIKLKFQIKLHKKFVDPVAEASRFRVHMVNKDILPVTLGTGEFLGYFVISNISEGIDQTLDDGTIFESSLDIACTEYVGDLNIANLGKAISSNDPARFAAIAVNQPTSGQLVSNYVDTTAMAAQMDKDIQDANNNPMTRAQKIKNALMHAQQIQKKLASTQILVANIFRLVTEAQNLKQKAKRSADDLLLLQSALQVNDMDSAMQANRDFQTNLNNVGGATAPFTKTYTLRQSA